MNIQGKEIIAADGKFVHRIGQDAYYKRCILLPNETIEDFEEVDAIPEPEQPSEKPSIEAQVATFAKTMVAPRTDLTDEQVLAMPDLFDDWEEHIDESVPKGMVLNYGGRQWRVRQEHTVQKIYPPSLQTASLYEVVERKHTGTIEDPIPYAPPMEIFEGKYYTQNGVKYRCTRDSGQALTHDLSALVGLYVEVVE